MARPTAPIPVGERFDTRTVIAGADVAKKGTWVVARCDCGEEVTVSLTMLRCGRAAPCQVCSPRPRGRPSKRSLEVVIGARYGNRVIVARDGMMHGGTAVIVECDCGRQDRVMLSRFQRGRATPCQDCKKTVKHDGPKQVFDLMMTRHGYRTWKVEDWKRMMRAKRAATEQDAPQEQRGQQQS